MAEKLLIKTDGLIEICMERVIGFDDCYGIYVFSGCDIILSTYGTLEEMTVKMEKIKARFEVL